MKLYAVKLCVVLSLVFALFHVRLLSAEEIKLGFFTLQPQIFRDADGRVKGVVVDYWEKHLAAQMGVTVKWVGPENIKRLTRMAKKGEIDGIAIFAKNPEREAMLNYPQLPFTQMIAGIALKKEHRLQQVNLIEDLATINVCALAGGVVPPLLLKAALRWRYNYSPKAWSEECLKSTANNMVESTFNAMSSVLQYDINRLGYRDQLRVVTLKGTELDLYSAFSTQRGKAFVDRFNKAHSLVRQQVNYDTLSHSYLR